ncbi:DNA-binding response regulator, LytR/AlgR family [Acetitomaculum ruminis DSM 5522]|uniref:Stage 0 sporulation protein A homolog n=1 Tax=Acetitomaculum ruminis DSM 5522 TaxID=1120918 RepID=A0A1I0VK70_9FIRM|nr:LytTR family DNA-binding domain-containing protein [Acetitomaculum ruminis]SFA76413.1 DNA-binding response regulator, LytR/AlgR family [Acetitomaculum ruminis DSM 5522]
MRIAIVDDETIYSDCLKKILLDFSNKYGRNFEIFTYESGEDFVDTLETKEYSFVFMDIYMKKINGIEAATTMRSKGHNSILVFLTTSTEFMPQAFSCHAFEYITKPFDAERVEKVLKDALKVIPEESVYITLNVSGMDIKILLEDIYSVLSDAHYLDFHTKNGKVLRCRMTGKQFLNLIDNDERFLAINRGIIVNMDKISEIKEGTIAMEGGDVYPVQIKNSSKIIQAIQDYNFAKIRKRQKRGNIS